MKIFNKENAFILLAMLCGFFICAEYAIVRPVSNSLFIHVFGSHCFPYAWLATVPLSLLAVSLYNYLLPRWGCNRLFFASIVAVILVNSVISFAFPFFPKLSFFFYVWKEVYIMLMFQQLWSVIHATIPLNRAKALYGIFFGVGGLGSIFGSSIPSFFAVEYGSETLLLMTLPLYALLVLSYRQLVKVSSVAQLPIELEEAKQTSWRSFSYGCKLIRDSRFLLFALIIVILMQLSSAFLDFEFNDALGRLYPDKDLRTQFSARLLAIGHFATVTLQFVGSYLFIRLLGVKKSHLAIPLLLGCNCLLYAFFPLFSLLSFSFMAIKAFDFSIFGVLREMLYVPLKSDEKFRAKAVIDIFAYRAAKAGAAFLILAFQPFLTELSILLCALWIGAIFWGLKDYEKVTA